jgi:biopolymer transport protein TolR
MGGMVSGNRSGLQSDINVTPLVDVVLVLLIIFMVIIPVVQVGYDVEIPKESREQVVLQEENKQVILSVSEADCPISGPLTGPGLPLNCQVRLNREPCPATELAQRAAEIYRNRRGTDRVLFLAAEEKLNYEGVLRLVDIARIGAGGDLSVGIVKDERVALVQ